MIQLKLTVNPSRQRLGIGRVSCCQSNASIHANAVHGIAAVATAQRKSCQLCRSQLS